MQGKKGDQATGQTSKQFTNEAGLKLESVSAVVGKFPPGKRNEIQHVNVTFQRMDWYDIVQSATTMVNHVVEWQKQSLLAIKTPLSRHPTVV